MIHADIVGERARLTPDKTALVSVADGARYTLPGSRCARRPDGRGVARALPDSRQATALACWRTTASNSSTPSSRPRVRGVILVPLGTNLTPHEIAFIAKDAGLRGFMYGGEFAETVRALAGVADVERWIALDEPAAPGHDRLAGVLEEAAARPGRAGASRPGPEDTCCLLYTSGTTGKPKGVMVPHRMVGWNGYNTAMCWQLREDDVSPIFTPLYHAGGLGAFLLPIFSIGGTIVLHAGFDPEEIWRTIERERCTVVLGVPTIYKLLMEAPSFQTVDLSHVRWLISGGAPLPLYIIEAYQQRGVVFKQGYGLTEVGVNCFSMTVDESARKKGSIGKPMMFTEARAAGPDGSEAAAGEVGELWLRGPHVCKGYWNNPEATAAALDADGWFHTGDLARRDEEGFYYIAGRQKDMLISGGVNVYPAEIEAELLLHPAVQDAAVVGLPDPTWGEIGAGCVVLRQADSVTGDELAEFLSARLAKYKIPRRWLFLDALPRTAYGKVIKGELRDRLL